MMNIGESYMKKRVAKSSKSSRKCGECGKKIPNCQTLQIILNYNHEICKACLRKNRSLYIQTVDWVTQI